MMHSGIDKAIKSMELSLNDIIKSENQKNQNFNIKHTYKTIDPSKVILNLLFILTFKFLETKINYLQFTFMDKK